MLVLNSSAGTLLGKAPLERFARRLAERGRTVFFVRYFDRTGTIFAGEEDIHRRWPLWNETVHDAVDFAAAHPRVRPEAIAIFGYSLGAYLAVGEATQDAQIDAVEEIGGALFRGDERRTPRVPPLLIMHGRADQRVQGYSRLIDDEMEEMSEHFTRTTIAWRRPRSAPSEIVASSFESEHFGIFAL